MTVAEKVEREMHGLEMIRAGIVQGLAMMPKKSVGAKAFRPLVADLDYRIGLLRRDAAVEGGE